ncbi:MAG: nucleoside triphosphate pyrophosphohydrolase, partial [Spirochaetales bacterium]|nr:nucleoside triphosphate pyrophosphohydrolase [Spirochaetales bacterium]
VVNLCRFKHVKPTDALNYANNKFTKRFNILINEMKSRGLQFEQMNAEIWDELWNIAKTQVH